MIDFFVISSNPMDGQVFNHIFKSNPNIKSLGQAFTFETGLSFIKEKKPKIIFLEIKIINSSFNIESVKIIKEIDPLNYLICFSLSNNFRLLQSIMDFGAYSSVLIPINRNRIWDIVNNIEKSIIIKNNNLQTSSSIPSYEQIFEDFLNCPVIELENRFNEVWSNSLIRKKDHFSRTVKRCQKFSTELYYYLIDRHDGMINETLIILYKNFMVEITNSTTKNNIKTLLYDFIKDTYYTINKEKQNISSDRINKVKKIIQSYIKEDKQISLEIIAEEMFMSSSYLSRTFKKIEGITFIEYVNLCLIDKAKVLLSTTHDTIDDIAYACGYNEPNSFRRLFKQKLGITPNAYRNDKINRDTG